MKKLSITIISLFAIIHFSLAQTDRWQQNCDYKMEIDFDVSKHQFTGTQKLVLTNNSPDHLDKVFYHLYFNAFQPGSMMDLRSLNIPDPDYRVGNRIAKLQPNEIGYHKIKSLHHNGNPVKYTVEGTILEVTLNQSIAPGSKATFDMKFESQVPLQVRRCGRDSKEGISYSMSQWYPKMCEYDYQGWHSNPYVGREFHGIWGDFDVKISIDKNYILAGSGYIQNPIAVGHGYEPEGVRVKRPAGDKLTWHFNAPNVHDFFWGADPDYTHEKLVINKDLTLHFLYQKNEKTADVWAKLPAAMAKAITYIEKNYGVYPYKQYSFVQGGDGGMEYPMGTLITGERNYESLVGVSVHEWMHSWYQMIMGSNEALYAWMDEGFTSYSSEKVMNFLRDEGILKNKNELPFTSTYQGYNNLASSGVEEPLTTHADHFKTNFAYGLASYVKGSVFLHQLEYIIGKDAFDKGMLAYYDKWKFKHPNPNDFIRIMEKASGLELDWYKEHWVNSINTIDYGIDLVEADSRKKTKIILSRNKESAMPMPIDIVITKKDGSQHIFNIPLRIMRGEKPTENDIDYTVSKDWPWTHPTYELIIPIKFKKIEKIEIDPSLRMADINRLDNVWKKSK